MVNLLPVDVEDELLRRWREPHRRYHGESHLRDGLATLDELGGTELERIAFWFHDAVHTNTTPDDELASAEMARRLLTPHLTPREVAEVGRLVLVTITHAPDAGDDAAARISDADLAGLAADWGVYQRNSANIRGELPGLSDEEWRSGRADFLRGMLGHVRLFHTAYGAERWEARARENMQRELEAHGFPLR